MDIPIDIQQANTDDLLNIASVLVIPNRDSLYNKHIVISKYRETIGRDIVYWSMINTDPNYLPNIPATVSKLNQSLIVRGWTHFKFRVPTDYTPWGKYLYTRGYGRPIRVYNMVDSLHLAVHLTTLGEFAYRKHKIYKYLFTLIEQNFFVFTLHPQTTTKLIHTAMYSSPDQLEDYIMYTYKLPNIQTFYTPNFVNYYKAYIPQLPLNKQVIQSIPDEYLHGYLAEYPIQKLQQYFNIINSHMLSVNELFLRIDHNIHDQQWQLLTSHLSEYCAEQQSVIEGIPFSQNAEYVGWGNFKYGFQCYNISDLIHIFNLYPNFYANPYRPHERFDDEDIINIYNVLPPSPQKEEFKSILPESKLISSVDDIYQWILANPEHSYLIKEYFNKLFELGMYLRRWQGPGYAYPLNDLLIEGETFECPIAFSVASKATQTGGILGDILKNISNPELILNLPTADKIDGQLQPSLNTIGQILEEVQNGNYCIRMTSTIIAYTGAYYLSLLFNSQPPGFDIHHQNIVHH